MTAVEVRYADRALAVVAAHVAGQVPGVARLAPRLSGRLGAGARAAMGLAGRGVAGRGAGGPQTEVSAVEITRDRGRVRAELRIVATMSRPPAETVRAVVDAVTADLTRLLGAGSGIGTGPSGVGPEVVVTVVDVVA